MAKILVIDDEPSVLEYVCLLLEKLGHSTVTASNCAEGIQALDDSVDFIISDIYMPDTPEDINAWLKMIKEKANGRPFVFITGFADQNLVDESMKLGAAGLLAKPFEMLFLKDLLSKLNG